MKPRYEYAEQLADSILDRNSEIDSWSTAIIDLCSDLRFDYREEKLEDSFSGAAIVDGSRKIVMVNSSHPEVRKRFSAAHEVGHLLLHGNQTLSIDHHSPLVLFRDENSSKGVDWREKEANFFAACLLMPRRKILTAIKVFDSGTLTEDQIQTLADKFEVSTQAMCIRLTQLGFLHY
jgi:Zn-dependent peptidase ImmA (M78 family)